MRRALALVLALLLAAPGTARAWGSAGHRVIALIAVQLLPPDRIAELDALLRASHIGRGIVEASTYPDEDIRMGPQGRVFAPWHYVNWAAGEAALPPDACARGCVVEALPAQAALGRDADAERRALALTWVLHLVADLHQPLHVGEAHDRGGNDVRIAGPDARNLHQVWDFVLVDRLAAGRSEAQLARDLLGDVRDWHGHPAAEGGVAEWARESHALVPGIYEGITPGGALPEDYVARNTPIVAQQMLRAGVRLARVIAENF